MAQMRRGAVGVTRRARTRRVGFAPAVRAASGTALWFSVLLSAVLVLAGMATSRASAADNDLRIDYVVVVPPNRAPAVEVQATISAPGSAGVSVELTLPEGVTAADIASADEHVSVVSISGRTVRVHSDRSSTVSVSYLVRLRAGATNPAGLTAAPYASLHAGEFAYLAGRDTLLRPAGSEAYDTFLSVRPPAGWQVFVAGVGVVGDGETLLLPAVETALFVVGPLTVARLEYAGGSVDVVVVGDAPWDAGETARSLEALASALARRGFADHMAPVTLVQLQYPGALRLNPLVSGFVAASDTIVHWIGSGTIDWWRKHAARDLVRWLLNRTVTTAADAAWFAAGLPEFVGLMLLHDANYISDDELYQALYTMYATGVHYTGPGWPSLVLAGVASPRSHSAQRVLEFRAPLVAFLLDAEIRRASAGAKSLIDLWLDAARQQQQQPSSVFFTSSLLAVGSDYVDLTTFAEDFLFGSRIPPVNFDAVYQRWAAAR